MNIIRYLTTIIISIIFIITNLVIRYVAISIMSFIH
jgi:hypothetical protein